MEHNGYRKFLKKAQQRVVPEIGELLPNFPVGTKNLYDFLGNGLLVIVVSTRCAACQDALAVLSDYYQMHSVNTVMLVDTLEDNMPLFYEAFAKYAEVFHMETENWKKHFAGVPWAAALDRNGVILQAAPFRSLPTLIPVLDFIDKEMIRHDD